jgi:hypothetical protein
MKNANRFFVSGRVNSAWVVCDGANNGLPFPSDKPLTFPNINDAFLHADELNKMHTCDNCSALFESQDENQNYCSENCFLADNE